MMKKITFTVAILLSLYAVLITFCSKTIQLTSDPIIATGHGAVIGENGQEIQLTPKYIETVQKYYLEKLKNSIEKKETKNYVPKDKIAETQKTIQNDVGDVILANALLMDWLIEKAEPKEGVAQLSAINNALRWQYVLKLQPDAEQPKDNTWTKGLKPDVAKKLQDKIGVSIMSLINSGGEAYCNDCLKAGVPIPKFMFGPEWKYVGEVTNEFLSAGSTAELLIYESKSPEGICLALPRYSPGSKIPSLFGVICLGTKTNKACFFDNKGALQFPKDVQVDFKKFVGGVDLIGGDVCSDCHAGENPYVVHPEQPAFMAVRGKFNRVAWYEPLVPAGWPQNPGPSNMLDAIPSAGKCNSCHVYGDAGRFPQVSNQLGGYCTTVLGGATAVGGTMPPYGGNRSLYLAHINALTSSCAAAPTEPGVDVPVSFPEDKGFISPPVVIYPLYQCATKVAVQSVVLDAKVILSVNGNPVGTVFPARNPFFIEFSGLTALNVGDKVTAKQEKNGITSAESAIVTVRDYKLDYPSGLPAPKVDPTLIYQCAEVMAVRHVPGAIVKVYKNGIAATSGATSTGWTGFYVGAIAIGDKFTAEISLCGNSSPMSGAEIAVAAPSSLPAATLNPATVFAGQELVTVTNLTNGSQTQIGEATFGNLGGFSKPESWYNNFDIKTPLGRPLNAGERLWVSQKLCNAKNRQDFPPATNCEELAAPRILHPIVGTNYVVVSQSVPGARIRIYDAGGIEIGDGSGTVIVLRRTITNTDTLTVVQQVGKCTSKNGYRVSVRSGNSKQDK